jgi:hypothetical protein
MKRSILILFFGLCTLGLKAPTYLNVDAEKDVIKALFYLEVYRQPFSPDLLRQALIYENIEYPEIVFRQAELETGNFTSEIFCNANNLFGMKLARVRETTAIGEFNGHARYNNWIDSVKDYRLWQLYYINTGHDISDYLAFLLYVNYATDENYINKLKT